MIGVDLQVYPTGIIPGLTYENDLTDKSSIQLRLGYQFIDHRDLGVQDDETGNGYGFSLGYKHQFNGTPFGWNLMVRNDFWWNTIDWENNDGTSGTTDITVVQPTALLEYGLDLGGGYVLSPSAAFGFEINVQTEGEPTGEGAIVLLGLSLAKQL